MAHQRGHARHERPGEMDELRREAVWDPNGSIFGRRTACPRLSPWKCGLAQAAHYDASFQSCRTIRYNERQ